MTSALHINMWIIAAVYLLSTFHLQVIASVTDSSDSECKNFTFLERSLFESESNRLQLSLTFFPLQDNPPEFVKVTYVFGTDSEIAPQVWFWSSLTSHFIHPFEVFQFMSLFFNKPEPYYSGALSLTLRSECADAGLLPNGMPRMQLLTQRVSHISDIIL